MKLSNSVTIEASRHVAGTLCANLLPPGYLVGSTLQRTILIILIPCGLDRGMCLHVKPALKLDTENHHDSEHWKMPPQPLMPHDILPQIFAEVRDGEQGSMDGIAIIMEILDIMDWLDMYAIKLRPFSRDVWRIHGEGSTWGELYDLRQRESIRKVTKTIQENSGGMQHVCPNRIWNIALAQNSNYSRNHQHLPQSNNGTQVPQHR